ncbi:DUF4349 domain-containing protein [Flavobacterium sp. AG291]|uniref:DUF4349 domain-containing protein n=1 Tax=Flavobacterium sp. AG291 TaxID=2184000 RepID=UPI000E0B8C76|nr:DUF4349 domain-containing protein [Flavobacterium sp. AG291]RDI08026.1 uncharacterized protein DUF4349 [Flavobacterium sp. AG291]
MRTIIVFIFLLVLSGCKEDANHYKEDSAIAAVEEAPAAAVSMAPMENADKAIPDGGVAYPEQKIIKNANLRFETDDLPATAEAIAKSVKKYQAHVQNDTEGKTRYELTRTMTVRIPAKYFDAFMADISKGVKYFDTKEISSLDVTEEYIDTDARIKAKKILEQRYLELIGKAKKVSEILEIEKELSAIREEIEAKEGQLRYMKSRIALSTINIEFYKETAEQPDATVSFGSKMWNAIVSGFNSLSSFFIGLLYFWPFILIFVIAFLIVRKKLKRKKYVGNS